MFIKPSTQITLDTALCRDDSVCQQTYSSCDTRSSKGVYDAQQEVPTECLVGQMSGLDGTTGKVRTAASAAKRTGLERRKQPVTTLISRNSLPLTASNATGRSDLTEETLVSNHWEHRQ